MAVLAVEGRVAVREPEPADARAFLQLVRASTRLHRPWVYPPRTVEAFDAYLARNARPDFQACVLVRRADGALLGMANLSQLVGEPLKSAYLGFNAFAPHAGQGYMTEGVDAVLRVAFRSLGLHRVEANVQPANVPSRALLTRLEFRCEGFSPRYLKVGGRWRDHERWAILAEEWVAGEGGWRLPGAERRTPQLFPGRIGQTKQIRVAVTCDELSSALVRTYGGHSSEPFA
jgi:[ribosomal protein S5]-alanine N-acetyltransferase